MIAFAGAHIPAQAGTSAIFILRLVFFSVEMPLDFFSVDCGDFIGLTSSRSSFAAA